YPGNEEVRPCRGVRTERYKYIHYFTEPQEFELYDLKQDPEELHNCMATRRMPSSPGNSPRGSRRCAARPEMTTPTSRRSCSSRKSPPESAKQVKSRPTDGERYSAS